MPRLTAGFRAPGAGRSLPRPVLLAVVAVLVLGIVAAVVLLIVGPGTGNADPDAAAPARLDRPGDVRSYVAAAGPAVVAVSSYDYRDLPGALAAGLPLTGGAYQRAYRAALTGAGAARARRERAAQSLDLLRVGVGALEHGGSGATLLVFGVEHASGTSGATARTVTLTATMQRQGERYLLTGLAEGRNAGLPAGSKGLRQAAEAARSEIVALLTFRRAHFADDEQRALDGATAGLRDQLARRAADTRNGLRAGHYDLTGAVTAVAVGSVAASSVSVLVAATGERIGAGGTPTAQTDGRYVVTAVRTADGWLISQITAYGA